VNLQSYFSANASDLVVDESLPTIYTNGCHLNQTDSAPKYCAFGNLRSKFKVVLVGDSHAAQWFPALEKLAEMQNFKLLSLTHSSCPFADLNFYAECRLWNANALKLLNRWDPDLVIWTNLIAESYPTNPSTKITKQEWVTGFKNRLKNLKLSKAKFLYIQDSPYPNFDVINCLKTSVNPSVCAFNLVSNQSESSVLQVLAVNNIKVVRTHKWFCHSSTCDSTKGNFNVYRDSSHISVRMSEYLSRNLGKELEFFSN
jgi:hypothetical protein